uniref:NADH dehydrogenase subunit 6 n=1 Tax=Notocotylus intestinalis TaxID=1197314 RepID=A0A8A4JGL5_9TREM|nr:NADH dehydrogenase subunit 6 [Notocotylus intestinalis]QTC30705.1 NADH dehydrogenase subunit 6 [Notocotylus intestinalis]
MLGIVFLSLYFSSLLFFSFVSHPVTYCVLLMSSALGVSGYLYSLVGFSWYLALFCLVYVGGVYVLFIFVSVHSPNPSPLVGGSLLVFLIFFVVIAGILWFNIGSLSGFVESSHYLCSYFEGFSYCLFCLVLMIGFVAISIVTGQKDAFYR